MTRYAGTDGVSLETRKWMNVLSESGHECFCFCGENGYLPGDRVVVEPKAHLDDADNVSINSSLFQRKSRSPDISGLIDSVKRELKERLSQFHSTFGIELFVAENTLSLPMHIPLGLALTEYAAESGVPVVSHNHDFWWERKRYVSSPAADYIDASFPPSFPGMKHVVINSVAGRQLSFRKGIGARLVPNVMAFNSSSNGADDIDNEKKYTDDMHRELAIDPDCRVLLQPTRIVPRKRIEKAIELVRALERKCVLLVTHESGDEGEGYRSYLADFARKMEVDVRFLADRFGFERGINQEGRKVYSLQDAYRFCDLVTYPSSIEGFGNAFLETLYFKKPIVMSAYEIFRQDIEPKGFQIMELNDYITPDLVKEVNTILDEPDKAREWVERNYELAATYYSFRSLKKKINDLIDEQFGSEIMEV